MAGSRAAQPARPLGAETPRPMRSPSMQPVDALRPSPAPATGRRPAGRPAGRCASAGRHRPSPRSPDEAPRPPGSAASEPRWRGGGFRPAAAADARAPASPCAGRRTSGCSRWNCRSAASDEPLGDAPLLGVDRPDRSRRRRRPRSRCRIASPSSSDRVCVDVPSLTGFAKTRVLARPCRLLMTMPSRASSSSAIAKLWSEPVSSNGLKRTRPMCWRLRWLRPSIERLHTPRSGPSARTRVRRPARRCRRGDRGAMPPIGRRARSRGSRGPRGPAARCWTSDDRRGAGRRPGRPARRRRAPGCSEEPRVEIGHRNRRYHSRPAVAHGRPRTAIPSRITEVPNWPDEPARPPPAGRASSGVAQRPTPPPPAAAPPPSAAAPPPVGRRSRSTGLADEPRAGATARIRRGRVRALAPARAYAAGGSTDPDRSRARRVPLRRARPPQHRHPHRDPLRAPDRRLAGS